MFLSGVACGLMAIFAYNNDMRHECWVLLIIMTLNFVGHEIVKAIRDK